MKQISTQCCIAGGGPAGMMLGYLLGRAGIDVIVLEKHGDFLRDFRGDTIHPSTLDLMHELGLLEEFLKLPHREVHRLGGQIGDTSLTIADFSRMPTVCKFIALMPQWDFLNFLADHARRFKSFHLRLGTAVTDVLKDGARVIGVTATSGDEPTEIRANLVIGADGRHSTVRERAGLVAKEFGAPMDVLWMRVPRQSDDPSDAFGHVEAGRIFIMLDRGDYWQCAFVIAKGSAEELRKRGIDEFRKVVLGMSPWLGSRVEHIKSWDDVKLLTVAVDRLAQWHRPGLLCIGDAAHAMSPIGGVGINLAVQDAVATANILTEALRGGAVSEDDLARVQRRREWPARVTQKLQIMVQDRVISRVLAGTERPKPPLLARVIDRVPILQGLPARLVGLGVRREHIRTPAANTSA